MTDSPLIAKLRNRVKVLSTEERQLTSIELLSIIAEASIRTAEAVERIARSAPPDPAWAGRLTGPSTLPPVTIHTPKANIGDPYK